MPFNGNKMSNRRIDLNITQERLADEIGINKATIHKYESGKIKNPSTDIVEQISHILKCSPAYLMDWSDVLIDNNQKNISVSKTETLITDEELLAVISTLPDKKLDEFIRYIDYLKKHKGGR